MPELVEAAVGKSPRFEVFNGELRPYVNTTRFVDDMFADIRSTAFLVPPLEESVRVTLPCGICGCYNHNEVPEVVSPSVEVVFDDGYCEVNDVV